MVLLIKALGELALGQIWTSVYAYNASLNNGHISKDKSLPVVPVLFHNVCVLKRRWMMRKFVLMRSIYA